MLEQAARAAVRSSRADLAIELLTEGGPAARRAATTRAPSRWPSRLLGDASHPRRRRDEGAAGGRGGRRATRRPRRRPAVGQAARGLRQAPGAELRVPAGAGRSREALAGRSARAGGRRGRDAGRHRQAALFQGRLWEARALFRGSMRARRADRVFGARDALRDDAGHDHRARRPVGGRRRPARDRSRRRGASAGGAGDQPSGNVAEDVRRTGDWDWTLRELETARQYELDDAGEIVARLRA